MTEKTSRDSTTSREIETTLASAVFELVDVGRTQADGFGQARHILEEISLRIAKCERVVVQGPSGAGKTTLLGLLALLDVPTSGELFFEGRSLVGISEQERTRLRRRLGIAPQDATLLPRLTVLDNVLYPLIPREIPRAERLERAEFWLARLGLRQRRHDPARQLSGGERQRLSLARALATEPEIVIADEPTSQLDLETRQAIIELLRDWCRGERTLIVATHDPLFHDMATRVLRLESGRLAEPGGLDVRDE